MALVVEHHVATGGFGEGGEALVLVVRVGDRQQQMRRHRPIGTVAVLHLEAGLGDQAFEALGLDVADGFGELGERPQSFVACVGQAIAVRSA